MMGYLLLAVVLVYLVDVVSAYISQHKYMMGLYDVLTQKERDNG